MSRLLFRSATSLALLLASVAAMGCPGGGGETCGPGDAPASGLMASGDAVSVAYGQMSFGLNNDCPVAAAPSGVVSMTIFGTQSGGGQGNGVITLCISRPDLLADGSQGLGPDAAGSPIRMVDLRAASASCSYTIDRSKPIGGSATSKGLCGNGSDPSGFALTLDGTLTFTRTCGSAVDPVAIMLRGTVAVLPSP